MSSTDISENKVVHSNGLKSFCKIVDHVTISAWTSTESINQVRCNKYRILGECLLISSLPGNALRTHVDIMRLAEI